MKTMRLFLIALLGLMFVSLPVVADNSRVPMPEITKGKGDQCVEPTADMRKNHMAYLKHKRDLTLRDGVRTKTHSLKECIGCHVKKDNAEQFIAINDEGQFCQGCHSYASVKIDCFECHRTTPEQTPVSIGNNIHNDSLLLNKLVKNQTTTDD